MKKYLKIILPLLFVFLVFFYLAENKNFLKSNSGISTSNFLKKTLIVDLKFPKDEGFHENASQEWWYFTAHLKNLQNSQDAFGLTLIHFKNGTNKLILIDVKNQKNYIKNISDSFSYDDSKLGLISSNNYWIEKELFKYEMNYEVEQVNINLKLDSIKEPMIIDKDPQSFSGVYLIQPRVNITGNIDVDGQKYDVDGMGWIEHQFFSKASSADSITMANSSFPGWDWWGIQLDNNTELAIYDIFSEGKKVVEKSKFMFVFDTNSSGTNFKTMSENDYSLEAINFQEGKENPKNYPISWLLKIPTENTTLKIKATGTEEYEITGTRHLICAVSGTYKGKEMTGLAKFEHVVLKK